MTYKKIQSGDYKVEVSTGNFEVAGSTGSVILDTSNTTTQRTFTFPDVAGTVLTNATNQFATVAAMKASPGVAVGDTVSTQGYTAAGDGGHALYRIVAAATGTDDGGSYHDLTGITGQAELITDGFVNVKQFGAVGDNATDDTTAINNALLFSRCVYLIDGTFLVDDLLVSVNGTQLIATASGIIKGTTPGVTNTPILDITANDCQINIYSYIDGNLTNRTAVRITGLRTKIFGKSINISVDATSSTGTSGISIQGNGTEVLHWEDENGINAGHSNASIPRAVTLAGAATDVVIGRLIKRNGYGACLVTADDTAATIDKIVCNNISDNGIYNVGGNLHVGVMEYGGVDEAVVNEAQLYIDRIVITSRAITALVQDGRGYPTDVPTTWAGEIVIDPYIKTLTSTISFVTTSTITAAAGLDRFRNGDKIVVINSVGNDGTYTVSGTPSATSLTIAETSLSTETSTVGVNITSFRTGTIKAGTDVAFTATDTITATDGLDYFNDGDLIIVTGSTSNNEIFMVVGTPTSSSMTVTGPPVVAESAGASVVMTCYRDSALIGAVTGVRGTNVDSTSFYIGRIAGKMLVGSQFANFSSGLIDYVSIEDVDLDVHVMTDLATPSYSDFANFSGARGVACRNWSIRIIDDSTTPLTSSQRFVVTYPTTNLAKKSYWENNKIYCLLSDGLTPGAHEGRITQIAQEHISTSGVEWEDATTVLRGRQFNYNNGVPESIAATPTGGYWSQGTDLKLYTASAAPFNTRCTVSGTPGTWVTY